MYVVEEETNMYLNHFQQGGTGYAMTNSNLEVKNERPVLQA